MDFQPLTGMEGRPLTIAIGERIRVGGNVIWLSDVIEVRNEDEVSSDKKGEPDTIITYNYFVHMAVAICEGPIEDIIRIWANGRLIFQDPAYLTGLTTGPMEMDVKDAILLGEDHMSIAETDGLCVFQKHAAYEATVTGCANAANNGTFPILGYAGNYDSATDCYSAILLENASAVTEMDRAGVTVVQVPWDLAPWAGNEVNFHLGDADQLTDPADPLLVAETGLSCKYPGVAYAVFNRLPLREWGHRVPQLTFEVAQEDGAVSGAAFDKIMGNAGLEASEWDSTDMDQDLHGIGWKGGDQSIRPLAPLCKAYDAVLTDTGMQLQFHDFEETDVQSILEKYLGAHEGTNRREPLMQITDVNDADLPDEVNVQYVDLDADHSVGSQRARRTVVSPGQVEGMNLPIILTAAEARHIANRILFRAWKNRQIITFTLPIRYGYVAAHDKLQVAYNDMTFYVHVLQADVGYNWLIEVKGFLEESANDS
jgi:hypothetical protein